MKRLILGIALLVSSMATSAEMTLSDVPVTFYGKVLGKINGVEMPLHFGELSMHTSPRDQTDAALTRIIELVKLDNGSEAYSYQMDVSFHQFLEITSEPVYYRPDELDESLPIGGTEQPLDFSNIEFIHEGNRYPAAVREPYLPAYEFISSQRADIARMDIVVDLPATLATDEEFAETLYDSFLAGLPDDAENREKTEDYDGDGVSNFDEILAGRDPKINEDRPRLLGDASRLRQVSVLDSVWRPFWMPVEDLNSTSDKVFVQLLEIPGWMELRDNATGAPINLSTLTLQDFQSGRIWARARPGSDNVSSGTVSLALGENNRSSITPDVHQLTVKKLKISRDDGLDSKVWLRADATERDSAGLAIGLSGHDHDRWNGYWQSYQLTIGGQDNQSLMALGKDSYLSLSNTNQHWRSVKQESTSTLVARLDASAVDQALFSDGLSIVRRLSAADTQYPGHIVVEQPTEGKRWVSQAPVADGWHVISLESIKAGQIRLWLDGVYAASRSIDIERGLTPPYPAVGAWFELDRDGTPVIHTANGLEVGEFLGYDRLLGSDNVRTQAAYLQAKWLNLSWVDRLGALSDQVASAPGSIRTSFISGDRENNFTGSSNDDLFIALTGKSVLTGGDGADRFVVGADSKVEDFDASEGDVIDLSGILSDAEDSDDWFTVLAVEVNADEGATILSVHPQGVGTTEETAIRRVTLSGQIFSKQDLVDLWKAGSFVAGRFRPQSQLSLIPAGDPQLSEQNESYRIIEVEKQGVGLPGGRRLPLAFSGTVLPEDYKVEFQSVHSPAGSDYLDAGDPANAPHLAALNGEIRFRISAVQDTVTEPEEVLISTLVPMPEWYDLGTTTSVLSQLVDGNDQIGITVSTGDLSEANEDGSGSPARVTFVRSGAIDQELEVFINVSGSAHNGDDFVYIASSVVFKAGSASETILIQPLFDRLVENVETVEIALQAGDGYEVGPNDKIRVTIRDRVQMVSLAVSEPVAATQDNVKATVLVERTGVTQGNMTVNFILSGTARNGADYKYINPLLNFAGTETTQTIIFDPLSSSATSLKYIDITLEPSTQYVLGAASEQRVYLVSSLTSDEDGDGIPDAWEIRNKLDPFVSDAHLDTDGDGLSNIEEHVAGSDPNVQDTDGDGRVDGSDAFPTDSTKTDFVDALYENKITLSPDLARSEQRYPVRLTMKISSPLEESRGMTLRIYYEMDKVSLDEPEFPPELGLVSSRYAVGDTTNEDDNPATNGFAEWVFYRAENDWYQTLTTVGNSFRLSFNWLPDMADNTRAEIVPHVISNGDPVEWMYGEAELEIVHPVPLDIDLDGVWGSEDDVRMSVTGMIDQINLAYPSEVQHGSLESEITDMGERIRRLGSKLDVDGDGKQFLYTDGLLIARYQSGLRGAELIAGAMSPQASRSLSEIEAYLQVMFFGESE